MSDKRIAIVMPTNVLRGAMCVTATDKYRPILRSVCIRGLSWPKDGGKKVELRVIATDSKVAVEFDYSYGIAADADVDVPDKFEWVVLPNDKLPANGYVRIEPNAEGTAANVRTYKGVVSFGQAMADVSPASYHVWDMPEGKYPEIDKLYCQTLLTVSNVSCDLSLLGNVEKAFTTAYGAKTTATFCGAGKGGAPLEFAVYDSKDERVARAIVMPVRTNRDVCTGSVQGADPGELASTRKALEEMHRLNAEKADTISKMSDRIAELEAALDNAITRYDELEAALEDDEPEIVEPDEIIAVDGVEVAQVAHDELPALPEPNTVIEPSDPIVLAIVPATASPTHVVAYWVPEGCTVRVSKGGNVWLDGPKEVTKANRAALKNAGWQWAVKRQQWWRKVA